MRYYVLDNSSDRKAFIGADVVSSSGILSKQFYAFSSRKLAQLGIKYNLVGSCSCLNPLDDYEPETPPFIEVDGRKSPSEISDNSFFNLSSKPENKT